MPMHPLAIAAIAQAGSQVAGSFFGEPHQPQTIDTELDKDRVNKRRRAQTFADRSIPRVRGTMTQARPDADIAFAQNPIMQAFLV